MSPTAPLEIQKSTIMNSARTNECRKRTGPPSSRTTRSPAAILPRERPRVSVSIRVGSPTITSTTVTSMIADAAAPSTCSATAPANQTAMSSTITWISRSSVSPSVRLGNCASRRSSATASPVTGTRVV